MAGASAVAASGLLARERRKSPKAKKMAAKAPITVHKAAGTAGGAWSLGSTVCAGGTGCGEDAGVGCDQLAGLVLRWGRYVTQAAGR